MRGKELGDLGGVPDTETEEGYQLWSVVTVQVLLSGGSLLSMLSPANDGAIPALLRPATGVRTSTARRFIIPWQSFTVVPGTHQQPCRHDGSGQDSNQAGYAKDQKD